MKIYIGLLVVVVVFLFSPAVIAAPEMVFVKGGCFEMGDTFGDGDDDERPVHEVCVDGFYIGKYEVTQGQWRAVMGSNPSSFQLGDNYPVDSVSWNDVQEFIEKLNKQSGMNYRLPTEAEWEYAARAGTTTKWYCGDDEGCLDSIAWYDANSGYEPHSVAKKQHNFFGLYDMSGNVWEWVEDDWHDTYNGAPEDGRPWIDEPRGPGRVYRGGSWGNTAWYCRSSIRYKVVPSYEGYVHGFRLVLPQTISKELQEDDQKRSPEATRDEKQKVRSEYGVKEVVKPQDQLVDNRITIKEFVKISAGEFLMGSPESDEMKGGDETPQHKVTIKNGFYMQKTEVTQGQWKEIMGNNPSLIQQGDDYPVDSVSWNDVQEFIEKLNKQSGMNYRLPTEAEWEYAARAGTTTKWYCGDDEGCLGSIAWYDANSDNKVRQTGKKQPNAWDLYDMSGNVWEWVEDDWHSSYTNAPKGGRVWIGKPRGAFRVLRGGGWISTARDCRSSKRAIDEPLIGNDDLGFRLVLPQAISKEKQEAKRQKQEK